MNIEQALEFAVDLVFDKTGVRLNKLDRIVLRGTLEGRTYREIQETEAEARTYEVDYLSRYVAYELRKRLTEALQAEGILKQGETFRKKNLLEHLEEALKQRSLTSAMSSGQSVRVSQGELQVKVVPSQGSHRAENAPNAVRVPNSPQSYSGKGLEETTSKFPNIVGREGASVLPFPAGGATLPYPLQAGYPNTTGLQDWGEAPDVSVFYGRTEELTTLEQWIVNDHCRLVTLLGMGGIGKTTLSVKLTQQIQEQFEYIIWRSLRHAPPFQEILADLIEFLSDEQQTETFATVRDGISQLMEYLRKNRCLVVLDEVETILRPGQPVGYYRDGYQDYGELLKRVGEVPHQSCLVLTSREKLQEMVLLEGEALPIRSLQLGGLKTEDAIRILEAKGFSHTQKELEALILLYGANPAALKIVAATIQELFNNDVFQFLLQNTLVIGDALSKLLTQQFERLSALEKEIIYWLAIERKAVDVSQLQADIWFSVPLSELLIALESLLRRSLIEKSTKAGEGCFTIQPVVMKYVTSQLIHEVCQDILAAIETQDIEKIGRLRTHALVKEQEHDEIKEIQYRLILTRVKDKLSMMLRGSKRIREELNELLSKLEGESPTAIGYALGNVRLLATLA